MLRCPDGAPAAVVDEKRGEPDSPLNMRLLQIACEGAANGRPTFARRTIANPSEKSRAGLFAIARFYSRLWFV
jgi:hypothetical protein